MDGSDIVIVLDNGNKKTVIGLERHEGYAILWMRTADVPEFYL